MRENIRCPKGIYHTPEEIARKIRKRRTWVRKHLSEWTGASELLKHPENGRVTKCYPLCVVLMLRLKAEQIPRKTGSWVTRNGIVRLFQISWRKAEKLLAPFLEVSKILRDEYNRAFRYFPPSVVKEIELMLA